MALIGAVKSGAVPIVVHGSSRCVLCSRFVEGSCCRTHPPIRQVPRLSKPPVPSVEVLPMIGHRACLCCLGCQAWGTTCSIRLQCIPAFLKPQDNCGSETAKITRQLAIQLVHQARAKCTLPSNKPPHLSPGATVERDGATLIGDGPRIRCDFSSSAVPRACSS